MPSNTTDSTQIKTKQKPKLLIVGPSETKVRGGIATVISGMRHSTILQDSFQVDVFASCINGHIVVRLLYTVYAYLIFLLRFWQYDVFHLHVASYGSTFRKMLYVKVIQLAHKKVVLHLHSGKYLVFYEGLSAKKQQKMVRFLQSADTVIALSNDWKAKFEQTFGLTNCIVVSNGVDTQLFAQSATPMQEVSNQFLFLGRLSEAKGIYDLIEAAVQVKARGVAIQCILAGEGDVEQVTALIAQKGLQDTFRLVGWVNDAQKLAHLKNVSTLVLPSHGEALPMVILEAMAAGKAIVATNVGAIPEVVKPENGILFAPKDTAALADAMVFCANNQSYLQNAACCNMQKIKERYSQQTMHSQMKDCLLQVLSSDVK